MLNIITDLFPITSFGSNTCPGSFMAWTQLWFKCGEV